MYPHRKPRAAYRGSISESARAVRKTRHLIMQPDRESPIYISRDKALQYPSGKSAHEAGSHCSSAGKLFCGASYLVSCFVPKPSGSHFRSSVHPGKLSDEVYNRVAFLVCVSSWCRYSVPGALAGWRDPRDGRMALLDPTFDFKCTVLQG